MSKVQISSMAHRLDAISCEIREPTSKQSVQKQNLISDYTPIYLCARTNARNTRKLIDFICVARTKTESFIHFPRICTGCTLAMLMVFFSHRLSHSISCPSTNILGDSFNLYLIYILSEFYQHLIIYPLMAYYLGIVGTTQRYSSAHSRPVYLHIGSTF